MFVLKINEYTLTPGKMPLIDSIKNIFTHSL